MTAAQDATKIVGELQAEVRRLTAERDSLRADLEHARSANRVQRASRDERTAERDALAEKLRQITDEAPGYVLVSQEIQPGVLYMEATHVYPTAGSARHSARSINGDPQVYALVPVTP